MSGCDTITQIKFVKIHDKLHKQRRYILTLNTHDYV